MALGRAGLRIEAVEVINRQLGKLGVAGAPTLIYCLSVSFANPSYSLQHVWSVAACRLSAAETRVQMAEGYRERVMHLQNVLDLSGTEVLPVLSALQGVCMIGLMFMR